LLLADEPQLVTSGTKILERLGFRVADYHSAEDALAYFAKAAYLPRRYLRSHYAHD
jgi:DNA-binding response OmpR family regulator